MYVHLQLHMLIQKNFFSDRKVFRENVEKREQMESIQVSHLNSRV